MWILTCTHDLLQSDCVQKFEIESRYVTDAEDSPLSYNIVAFTDIAERTDVIVARNLSLDEAHQFLPILALALCENRAFASVSEIHKRVQRNLTRAKDGHTNGQ